MQQIDLLVHSAGQLCVIPGEGKPQRGLTLGTLGIIEDGALAVHEGRVLETGPSDRLIARYTARTT